MIIALIAYGCSRDDAPDPDPNPSPDPNANIYTNIDELQNAIDTVYVHLGWATRFNTFHITAWAGDDITTTAYSAKWDYIATDRRDQLSGNARAEATWRSCYTIINEANAILLNSKGLETAESETKNRLLGEAHFIRGFMYHHLIRMFGEIPLQLKAEINPDLPFSETVEVYKQIEKDWLEAARLLPMIYPGVEPGAARPNKGSALAFLARLYLDWGGFPVKDPSKYGLAASYAKQVIDNHASHGFDLMQDLDDLWTLEHRFNKESIFTLVYCKTCKQGGNYKTSKLGLPLEIGGWAETFGEIKFFETFPDNHRKQATYITDLMIDDPHNNPSGGPTQHWTTFNQPNPFLAKITGKGDIPRDEFITDRNDYVMRYAEVLLTFAEASARSGNSTPEAWEALNKIKRRAELLPPNEPNALVDVTTGDLAELAYAERGWELAGEFLRWYDLTRMERVAQFLNNDYRNNTVSTVTDPEHPDYGSQIQELIQIIGSTDTENYFTLIPSNYKDLFPMEEDE